jgi:hypothetical protein
LAFLAATSKNFKKIRGPFSKISSYLRVEGIRQSIFGFKHFSNKFFKRVAVANVCLG